MQMLLDPIVMEFSNVDMMKIENNMDLFLNFGFEIELFGNNQDRKSTRLNSSHIQKSRMPSSA